MTTPSARLLWLPLVVVLLMHWFGISWLWANIAKPGTLVTMADPMFTRLLVPATPAPPKLNNLKPAHTATKKPRAKLTELAAKTIEPTPLEPTSTALPALEKPVEELAAPVPPEAAPVPQSLPELAAQAPDAGPLPGQNAADPLDHWPLDTRLSYKLSGFYHGKLYGGARVQWQRVATRYQVMLSLRTAGLTLATLTSQGDATPTGLVPRIYEESLPGGPRRAEFSDGHVRFQNGNLTPVPPGVQDTVSQFVELTYRFTSGRTPLATGSQVRLWLARPGGLDEWVYDVGELETLQSPEMGPVSAYPLKPRPLANPRGPITAELWFAPGLQYLPVRIRVQLGGEDFVDLMIEQIEQASGAQATSPPASQSIQ